MSITEFLKAPWGTPHPLYSASMLALQPAPEFATAEVMIASLYRASGYAPYGEREVTSNGRKLDKQSRTQVGKPSDSGSVGPDTWHTILHSVVDSPKQRQQSDKRFLQLSPVVPDVALYSGSARLTGSPWRPGELVKRMVWMGARSSEHARQLWQALYEGLSITAGDDAWARWLHDEFERRATVDSNWKAPDPLSMEMLSEDERAHLHLPARQFTHDLEAVLAAKSSMTRRQWVSVLESIVRLGAVSHVLWLCRANHRLWQLIDRALGEAASTLPDTEAALRSEVLDTGSHYFAYGRPAQATIKDCASRYLVGRLGTNLALWMLWPQTGEREASRPALTSAGSFVELLRALRAQAPALRDEGFYKHLGRLRDEHSRTINCKSGIGNNIGEFCKYVLGRRETATAALRGYDQGYAMRKRSEARNAQFVISLGPVAVLALVHCCLWGVRGPRSVQRLAQHMAAYGIAVSIEEIAHSDLGHQLRMLGLVLDSPDAESGMLLVPPFTRQHEETVF
jgi:hypothetical protein